jgi:hypothetical protein
VKATFEDFKMMVENETGLKIKKIHTDNGTEYVNQVFQDYPKRHGIKRQCIVPHCPQQNGVAEIVNQTVMEMARCMMQEASCDRRMWAEAANTAVYLRNTAPHKAVPEITPEEKRSSDKVDLSHLRIFGCKAYVHIPDGKRKTLDVKSKMLTFVGYCEGSKYYRLLDPQYPSKIVRACDVVFLEAELRVIQHQSIQSQ